MSLKRTPNSLFIYFMVIFPPYLLFIISSVSTVAYVIQINFKYNVAGITVGCSCNFRKGKQEQFETVAPCKWLSRDEKQLQQPPSLQVKSKVHCDPDVTTWKKFKVLKIKIRGMQTHFVKVSCGDGSNPLPSIDNPNIYGEPPFYLFSKSLTFDIF